MGKLSLGYLMLQAGMEMSFADLSSAKTFHLCDFEGFIQFLPVDHTTDDHTVFFKCPVANEYMRFETLPWGSICRKMFAFYEKEKRCPKLSRP